MLGICPHKGPQIAQVVLVHSHQVVEAVVVLPYSAVSFPTAASSSSLTGETVMMGRMAAPVIACRINSAWLMLQAESLSAMGAKKAANLFRIYCFMRHYDVTGI